LIQFRFPCAVAIASPLPTPLFLMEHHERICEAAVRLR
jgi:hypothetical protein